MEDIDIMIRCQCKNNHYLSKTTNNGVIPLFVKDKNAKKWGKKITEPNKGEGINCYISVPLSIMKKRGVQCNECININKQKRFAELELLEKEEAYTQQLQNINQTAKLFTARYVPRREILDMYDGTHVKNTQGTYFTVHDQPVILFDPSTKTKVFAVATVHCEMLESTINISNKEKLFLEITFTARMWLPFWYSSNHKLYLFNGNSDHPTRPYEYKTHKRNVMKDGESFDVIDKSFIITFKRVIESHQEELFKNEFYPGVSCKIKDNHVICDGYKELEEGDSDNFCIFHTPHSLKFMKE